MTQPDDTSVPCPGCGKRYRHLALMAGKRVECKVCHTQFDMPNLDPLSLAPSVGSSNTTARPMTSEPRIDPSGAEAYDLHDQPTDPPKAGVTLKSHPHTQGPVPAVALPTVSNTSTLTEDIVRKRIEDQERLEAKMLRVHRIREYVAPPILLAFGLLAVIVVGQTLTKPWYMGLAVSGLLVAIQLVLMLPMLLMSIMLCARWFGLGFGSFFTALVKLTGVSVGPGAVADVVLILILPLFLLSGSMIAMAGAVIAIYALFLGTPIKLLFDLEWDEVGYVICVVVIVRTVVFFTLFAIAHALFF
ncbi:MAG: hypothetical protein GC164_11665 [Phycisphaera sp.]|nr:hypothetical protein [Phycisphaera sp.]